MKTALSYFTAEGEKRLTPLGEALCLIGVLLAWISTGIFLGEGFAFGLAFGFMIGALYMERATRNRERREDLKRAYAEKSQRELEDLLQREHFERLRRDKDKL